jgi:hypothetical protein
MTLRVFLCQSILIMPEKLMLFGKPPCETTLYDRRCLNNYYYTGELRSPFIPMYDTHAKQHRCMTVGPTLRVYDSLNRGHFVSPSSRMGV